MDKFDKSQPSHESFRDLAAQRTSPLIAWVGSGVSAPAGLPTWGVLRNYLLVAAKDKIATLDAAGRDQYAGKIDAATNTPDHWLAFELIKSVLGQVLFKDKIREHLSPTVTAAVPVVYSLLWRLRLSGLINLNLDRLATRAYTKQRPGDAPAEFNGLQSANWIRVLKSPHPFIINMHGVLEDSSSWALTRGDLKTLFTTPGYEEFILSCLTTRTVLFVGLSVDDVAVGGHLERLSSRGIETGPHYWLTNRVDAETDAWADKVGVTVIRYPTEGDNHDAIAEFFDDVIDFVPAEPDAKPVTLELTGVNHLPPPKELRREDAETIRTQLNARATEILQAGTEEAYEEYESFCKEYNEAVYRAWYVDLQDGDNELLGYRLRSLAGSGAFGTVYQAIDNAGDTVAVKILHEDVRKTPEMLQSFRRGVRSMRILTSASLDGIVKYRAASEIPAFVVMDWVEGPNLREAVQAKQLNTWSEIIQLMVRLCRVIKSAHMLPDRVLHRDLRPANIMLEGFWSDTANWTLVVLDFDLSYHVGSLEKTIDLRGESATGYLAPEQLQRLHGVSTRNAAVDSFGLGMTLFYMVTRRDPVPGEHMHGVWPKTVLSACSVRESKWTSLPARVARVILNCTRERQAERWDVSQIDAELSRMASLIGSPAKCPAAELVAEELLALAADGDSYDWNEDTLEASVELASGILVKVRADEPNNAVQLVAEWASSGQHNRKAIIKWLPDAAREATELLRAVGWVIRNVSTQGQAFHITADADAALVFDSLKKHANALNRFTHKLTLR